MTTGYDYLKSATDLGVTNVLDTVSRVFGIEGEERGDEYDILCPDPAHNDTTPSVSVNLTTGFWHCFSCGRGGDLLGLGRRALSRDTQAVEQLLRPSSPDALAAILRSRLVRRPRTLSPTLEVPAPASYSAGPLRELLRRGFTAETLRRWDVRYVPHERLMGQKGPFNIYASIGIPIEDDHGRVLAWCYRRTDQSAEWQPRYLYTYGSDGLIRDTWFGLQHHGAADEIVIVEGALDAMWCDQCGIPALALLGTGMATRKLQMLRRYRRVILLGDLDAGGAEVVVKIGNAIGGLVPTRVASYSSWMDARDPAELHPVDLELAVLRSKPWPQWKMAHVS